MNIHFLGELALNPAVRLGGDTGNPITLGNDGAPFVAIAREVERRAKDVRGETGPTVRIED
jgi:hypothetical protein